MTTTAPSALDHLSRAGEAYFLTPVCLVPNGRAHLGHVAGPLLKLDVLKRHLTRAGAAATLVSLSDVHESHVLIRAHLDGRSPEDVANGFHSAITADMAALNIGYDDLINPLDPEWSEVYERVNRELVEAVRKAGNAAVRNEPVPVLVDQAQDAPADSPRPRLGDPVVSGWLRGRCPGCGSGLVGFFCEACGGHYEPHEMQDLGTAHFEGDLELKERASLYLRLAGGPQAILDQLRTMQVRPDFIEVARRHLERRGTSIRLTVPSPWGIPVTDPELSPGEVIWSYSALLIGCHLVAGERYRALTGAELNPFDARSDVVTVLSFGIDNAVPFLVGATGCLLGQDAYKPVDHFLVNYFYDLDGQKFSTSRGHVVWAGDIVELGTAEPDLVRAYLVANNPEFGRENFSPEAFLALHADLGGAVDGAVRAALDAAEGAAGQDQGVLRHLVAALETQDRCLTAGSFDLAGAGAPVDRWIAARPALTTTAEAALTWLVGLSVLAYPVMPDLGQRLWALLGRDGAPRLAEVPAVRGIAGRSWPGYRSLSRTTFDACLPPAIRSAS